MDHDEMITKAYEVLRMSFDNAYGSFGSSRNFLPHNLIFSFVTGIPIMTAWLFQWLKKTLDAMYRGGIFDHIGFGFSAIQQTQMAGAPFRKDAP